MRILRPEGQQMLTSKRPEGLNDASDPVDDYACGAIFVGGMGEPMNKSVDVLTQEQWKPLQGEGLLAAQLFPDRSCQISEIDGLSQVATCPHPLSLQDPLRLGESRQQNSP
jgi:hypothetical protein